jgi:glutamate/aspartate transport system permease protein
VRYHWDWGIFWQPAADGSGTWLSYLLAGVVWTLATALAAWVIALAIGSIVGVVRTTPSRWAVRLGNGYVELFRNIPLLVQMFLWFFVLPELLPPTVGERIKQMPPPWSAYVPAVLCLGFYTAARVAEQVRAGVQSLPRGQMQAATAVGFTLAQAYRHVVLPQAYRIILPPLTSEFLNIIKNSAVALTIGLLELTARARSMQEFTFQVFEAFTAATILYLLINIVVVVGMRWIEKRLAVPGLIAVGRGPQAGH